MPIDIQNLHIKSTVVQRSSEDATAPATAAASAADTARAAAQQREQLLAECKRLIRDTLNQRQER